MNGAQLIRPMHILVLAKSPVAGRVKTRLCPPFSPAEAAEIAAAALADTLQAADVCAAGRRVLALDGPVGDWLPHGWRVVEQRGDTMGQRLAAAWSDTGGAGLQIGMDTPQVTTALIDAGLAALETADAALGPAHDGGWWALAQRVPDPDAFDEIPMSVPCTGIHQLRRLRQRNARVALLPGLRDVDTVADARAVAAAAPTTHFGRAVARLLSDGSVPTA